MRAEVVMERGSMTQETLRLMANLVQKWHLHPVFVRLARMVCGKAGARTREQEAEAIHGWILKAVTYRRDPVGAEWVQDPFETAFVSRAGDCDDMAVVAGTMLQALGHPCRMMAVWWTDRDSFSHAVCMDDAVGCVVDPVADNFKPWPPAGRVVRAMMEAP